MIKIKYVKTYSKNDHECDPNIPCKFLPINLLYLIFANLLFRTLKQTKTLMIRGKKIQIKSRHPNSCVQKLLTKKKHTQKVSTPTLRGVYSFEIMMK